MDLKLDEILNSPRKLEIILETVNPLFIQKNITHIILTTSEEQIELTVQEFLEAIKRIHQQESSPPIQPIQLTSIVPDEEFISALEFWDRYRIFSPSGIYRAFNCSEAFRKSCAKKVGKNIYIQPFKSIKFLANSDDFVQLRNKCRAYLTKYYEEKNNGNRTDCDS